MTLALAGLMVTLFGVGAFAMLRGFARVEDTIARRNVTRVVNAVETAIETLTIKTADWACWDDTYKFVEDRNEAYRTANLQFNSLNTLRLDSLFLIGADGAIMFAARVNTAEQRVDPAGPEVEALIAHDPFFRHESEASIKSGVLMLPDRVCLAVSRPILTSDQKGPSHGTLVFLMPFGDDTVASISDKLKVSLSMWRDDRPLDAGGARARDVLATAGDEAPLEVQDADTLCGFASLRAVNAGAWGERARLLLRVGVPRFVHQQALVTLAYYAGMLGVCGLAFLWLSSAVLRRLVLTRLSRLSSDVTGVAATADGAQRVVVDGDDELGQLAARINAMLAALAESRAQADRAGRARADFVAHMSHELRTPMTAILGSVELLADPEAAPDEREQNLRAIESNGRHLLDLLNDVLDFSKIEAGAMPVELAPCSPTAVVEQVIDAFRGKARAKGIELSVEHAIPQGAMFDSDALRLRQILHNLVGNALKFTAQGGIALRTSHEERPDGAVLRIDVRDTGIGMTPEQRDRLFRPFTQADASMARKYGGTGLGLTISQRLAELLGGRISIESEEGLGSTFTVTVSARGWRVGAPAAGATVGAGGDGANGHGAVSVSGSVAGVRVLLAEDGPDNQRLLTAFLTKAGAVVELVENGQAAFERASAAGAATETAFAVVLMDMQMPIMDGYEATRRLRGAGYAGPIVALTAHTGSGERERCLAAGCNDYLNKPIARRTLIETVARWSSASAGRAAA